MGGQEYRAAVPETRASIATLYQEAGIHFAVANTGDDVWDNGFVAYGLTVTRDGTLVQTDGGTIDGIAPGSQFPRRVDFLGASVSGTYTFQLVVTDQTTGSTLASETFTYEHTAAGDVGPSDTPAAPRVASVPSLYKDGDIFLTIVNGGETTWESGDVSWQLDVTRDGTLVQSTQQGLSGVPPQGSFSTPIEFLGKGVPGDYFMRLQVFDLRTGQHIGGMEGSFTESA